jgi:ASC-1-like (ASCH) protein
MKFQDTIFLTLFSFASCSEPAVETQTITTTTKSTSGTGISVELRNEIESLNKIILQSIVTKNPDLLNDLKSENLAKSDQIKFNKTFLLMGEMITSEEYSIFEEIYVQNSKEALEAKWNSENSISNKQNDTNSYSVIFTSGAKEAYLSLLIQPSEFCDFLITTLYGKYDGQWKLDAINVSDYALYGKTASEHYYDAKSKYESNKVIPAYFSMQLSLVCLRPSMEILVYDLQEEIEAFNIEVTQALENQLNLPIKLETIKNSPEIIGLGLQAIPNREFLPRISYKTQIDINDKDAVKKENEGINKIIDEVLPGIAEGFRYVVYQAFNELPNDSTEVANYTFAIPQNGG